MTLQPITRESRSKEQQAPNWAVLFVRRLRGEFDPAGGNALLAIPQKLKEYLVYRLSPRFKSRLRSRLYTFGLLRPRPPEQLVLDIVKGDKAETFLQIGVNDGQYADPLNLAVHLGLLRGTLVEPEPDMFKVAQETYRGITGLEFVKNAISDRSEYLPLYTFEPRNRSIPAWVHGVASLSREHVLRVAGDIPDIERHIVEVPVEAVTVPMLLDRIGTKRPDIIVVDAEGYDAAILRQFDFEQLRPKLVLYESENMTPEDREEIERRLLGAGFKLVELGQDTAAIHPDTQFAKSLGMAGSGGSQTQS